MAVGDRTTYVIDRDDRVQAVNGGWSAFAQDNGASALDRAHVLGESIWRHIKGTGARRFFQAVFDKARRGGDPIVFPFRCDSPGTLRRMRMQISPGSDGSLAVETQTVEEAPRRVPGLYEPPDDRAPEDGVLLVCTVCKSVRDEAGRWLELDDALEQLDLFDPATPVPAYDVCPSCQREIFEEAKLVGAAPAWRSEHPVDEA